MSESFLGHSPFTSCITFAHRVPEGGWTVEGIAYYFGHTINKGTPAIRSTVRYTQEVSREEIKDKLRTLPV